MFKSELRERRCLFGQTQSVFFTDLDLFLGHALRHQYWHCFVTMAVTRRGAEPVVLVVVDNAGVQCHNAARRSGAAEPQAIARLLMFYAGGSSVHREAQSVLQGPPTQVPPQYETQHMTRHPAVVALCS